MEKPSWFEVVCMVVVFSATTAVVSPAQVTTLVNFNGSNGKAPAAPLVQGSDGNFYGTTASGGSSNRGTVFKVTANGTLTTLHSFSGNDGQNPTGGLIQARDGNFYGTTSISGNGGPGGTVFKITPSGSLTTLVTFDGQGGPEFPYSGVIQGRDGNFYGTTPQGGTHFGNGTVYKITPNGTVTTLYSFACSGNSGCRPMGALVQGSDGNFYGTTTQGGPGSNNSGAVFKITPSGTVTTLHNFCTQSNCADGDDAEGALIQAGDGNFYGTTNGAGAHRAGTVFKITPGGALTTLYSFCPGGSPCADGAAPQAGLVQASDGNFYGTTYIGGANNVGTLFQITPSGTLTTMHSFNGGDGAGPEDALIQARDGNFYGTSSTGGSSGDGTAFKFQLAHYTLTVSPTGQGSVTSSDGFINCPGTCSHSYLQDSRVALTANPALGWSFSAWGGACSGGNPSCTVTMTGDESVSATFTQNSYTLTVSISGQGSITSTDGLINCPGTCSHTYLSLTQVTLNESPAQGWTFAGWSGACTGLGSCTVTMLDNLGVSAYFLQPGHGLRFSSMTPCRLVDTRPQNGGGGPITGGTFQTFDLPQLSQSKGCADLSSAAAFSLNVTLVPQNNMPVSYLTIWPAGMARPTISTMNSLDGRIKANAAVVPAGTSGSVSIFVTNTTNVVVDIDGYFAPSGSSTLEFYPLTPCRVADTRKDDFPPGLGSPYLTGGVQRNFPVLNAAACNIPGTAQAYSLNFTAVPHPFPGGTLGYLEVWPEGQQPQHPVSTLNNLTGTLVANAAIVPAGTGGAITVLPDEDTDLVIDINGYFDAPRSGGMSLYPSAPCRVIDTRQNNGQPFTGELTVPVRGSVCAPPANTQAYVFNATVVPSGGLSYLTLWPDSEQQPTVSTLNALDGWVTSNMAIVPNVNGSTDAFAAGSTWLVLDISSYFGP